MIDVLMLAVDDWSNTGWRYAKCLRRLGLDVEIYKGREHIFQYPEQAPVHPAIAGAIHIGKYPVIVKTDDENLREKVESARVVHFVGETLVDTEADLSKKRVVVDKGGSTFRIAPASPNMIFNPIVDASIILCPDLLGLGSKNEHLIYYPVDTDLLVPDYGAKGDRLVVGHWPSTSRVKGTETILEAVAAVNDERLEYVGLDAVHDMGRVSWQEHLRRVSSCDVLIETCNPELDGRPFGAWGNQAIEAAALGCVVITNDLYQDVYAAEYGRCELMVANTAGEITGHLHMLLEMSPGELREKMMLTRSWVVENHSMDATAERLWEKVYKYLIG